MAITRHRNKTTAHLSHDKGSVELGATVEIPNGPSAPRVHRGDDVVPLLWLEGSPGGAASYSIMDHQRSTPLRLVGAAFALAVIAFGRWRGLTALAGLGVAFAVLLLFIVVAMTR